MAQRAPDLTATYEASQAFPEEFETLLMATCNNAGQPEASYAAYLQESGDFYVYLSELAAHTGNLQQNPKCSVLFIENEQDARHLFARRRLTYQCEVSEVARHSHHFDNIMDRFEEKFGAFINMMRKLKDFHLFRLKPCHGNYVAGFAQAFEISGDDLSQIRHRNEQGHQGDIRQPQVNQPPVKKAVGE